jgi:hypothetical protein
MLYREIIAACSEIHTKHINTLCGQNVAFVNVKPGGTYSNHWAVKGQYNRFKQLSSFCWTCLVTQKWTSQCFSKSAHRNKW